MGRGHPVDAKWKRLRLEILKQADHECCYQGCPRPATEVDHIVPISLGGDVYDRGNLRAICRHHNASRGNGTRRGRGGLFGHGRLPHAAFSDLSLPERAGEGRRSTVTHREVPT
jgi:5-methylcytosine-specific restriction endonuclease McrA